MPVEKQNYRTWMEQSGLNFTKTLLMKNVEHIGIAVNSLANSIPLFQKLLNTPCYKTETVESEAVNTAFFQTGATKIELLESTTDDGVIKKFLDRKGEGIHHLAFEVADIHAEMARLKEAGFVLLNEQPKRGADNKWVCFLHPKSTHSVLIEICQERREEEKSEEHNFSDKEDGM